VCTRRLSADALTAGWQEKGYLVEPDRRTAIAASIKAAHAGDAVLIAGKGHETYQILAGETIHFDDREEARQVLAAMNGPEHKTMKPFGWTPEQVLTATGGSLISGSADRLLPASVSIRAHRSGPSVRGHCR
jgi:hypothetical protein